MLAILAPLVRARVRSSSVPNASTAACMYCRARSDVTSITFSASNRSAFCKTPAAHAANALSHTHSLSLGRIRVCAEMYSTRRDVQLLCTSKCFDWPILLAPSPARLQAIVQMLPPAHRSANHRWYQMRCHRRQQQHHYQNRCFRHRRRY